ncbi:unnamed protein product [Blepharisma stoltei]|uniref:Uncharacterized protein n=1 Tax=Blepharisma stoltei TaxID=1481888 RepID=A0AAU9IFM7_9CILI|nr:unnamed protein product [Blepharisma stoltei]
MQNWLTSWLYTEAGCLYFFFGKSEIAEYYFNLVTIRRSDVIWILNAFYIGFFFYVYKLKREKAEEVLESFKKKYAHFSHEAKFHLYMAEIGYKVIFNIKYEQNDKEFEELGNKLKNKKWSDDTFFMGHMGAVFRSFWSEGQSWNNIAEIIFNWAIGGMIGKSPLFAYTYIAKSNWERSLGNHEVSREYLVKSLGMLKSVMSQKNDQVKMIENQLIEVEKEIVKKNNEK